MIQARKNKVGFQTRIRPELSDQIDLLSRNLGIPKTKLTQLALGDLAYKLTAKLPKSEAKGFIENYDPESLTDTYIQGRVTGVFDYTALAYYMDMDLPEAQKGE